MRLAALLLSLVPLVPAVARAQRTPPAKPEPDEAPLEVVVTGRRSEQRLGDSAVAVEVIGREQIVASGARDAAQALANQPGVNVESSFRGDAIQLQGLDPQHTLILVDGERLIGARDGALDLARLFAGDIERIEIVRGPASAIYGSDAIAGVINIITRSPRARPGAEAQARYGIARGSERVLDELGHQGDVWASGYGGVRERFAARGTAAYRRNAAYDLTPSTPSTTGNRVDTVSANLRTNYAPSSRFRLPSFVRVARREGRGIDEGAGGAIYDRVQRGDELAITALPTWSLRAQDALTLALNYAYLRSQFLRDQRRDDDGDTYEDASEQLATIRLQSDVEAHARVHVSSGVEALGQRYVSPRLSEPGQRGRLSPYAQLEWRIVDRPSWRFMVVPSARLDLDSQYGVNVSPRIALRLDPHRWITLRAAVGRGFRAPSFSELLLDFANPAANYRVSGNQELSPERSLGSSVSAELHGVRWLSASLNLFHNALRDLIDTRLLRVEQGEQLFAYANIARVRTQGIESSVQLRPVDDLLLELSYTLTHSRDLERERPLSGRALHRGALRVQYRAPRYALSARCLLVGARRFYIDDDSGTTEIRARPYAVLDLRASLRLGEHFEPFFTVENATDGGDADAPLRPATVYAGLDVRY